MQFSPEVAAWSEMGYVHFWTKAEIDIGGGAKEIRWWTLPATFESALDTVTFTPLWPNNPSSVIHEEVVREDRKDWRDALRAVEAPRRRSRLEEECFRFARFDEPPREFKIASHHLYFQDYSLMLYFEDPGDFTGELSLWPAVMKVSQRHPTMDSRLGFYETGQGPDALKHLWSLTIQWPQ